MRLYLWGILIYRFFSLMMSLFGFGITESLFSYSELLSAPSSHSLWKSLCRIGILSFFFVFWPYGLNAGLLYHWDISLALFKIFILRHCLIELLRLTLNLCSSSWVSTPGLISPWSDRTHQWSYLYLDFSLWKVLIINSNS